MNEKDFDKAQRMLETVVTNLIKGHEERGVYLQGLLSKVHQAETHLDLMVMFGETAEYLKGLGYKNG